MIKLPKVGETWRWSYCENWCCGGQGVVTDVGTYKGDTYFTIGTEGQKDFDEVNVTGYDAPKTERVS